MPRFNFTLPKEVRDRIKSNNIGRVVSLASFCLLAINEKLDRDEASISKTNIVKP